ncbi:MAG: T9SS type A sorting domain-containing protein [Chitinophagaceae bacterium]
MKKPIVLLLAVIISAVSYFVIDQKISHKETEKEEYYENEEEEEEAGADKQLSMWYQGRAYPNPYFLNDKYQRAWDQVQKIKEMNTRYGRVTSFSNWASLGHSADGLGRIGGRIKCIAIDPNNPNNLWAGSASGGIWKSTNAGSNWSYVPVNMHVLGVSSIIIDPSNSNVIYAGTGEVYRVDTSNIGYNVWKARGTYGIGIIKSTNGGTTWSQVMTKTTEEMFAIQMLAFDPTNSNTIYACATDGLYRSTNNGTSWSQILAKTYVKDIAIDPSNTDQIVVSVGNMVNPDKGIYRTTNGNNASPTWAKITSGLPATFEGSILLDNVGSGEMVASIGRSSSTAASNREVYRSTNFGATWAVVGGTTSTTTTNHCSYQFWFAHTAAINPFFTDSIMFAGVGWYRYRVSTTSRATVSASTVHADVHDIKFDPAQRGRIYVCCDGGIFKSTNGGANFTAINTGLNATQFYASLGVSSNVTTPNRMIGGLQDNGQVLYNGTQWNQVSWAGGDGTSCAIDPSNHNNMLASRDAKQVFRSTDGGGSGGAVTNYWGFAADSRTGFIAPLAFSKSSPTTVYLASDNLHKSTNSGGSFTNDPTAANAGTAVNFIEAQNKTAIALAVSPTNANKVYVSTSPFAQMDNDVSGIIVTGQPNLLRTATGGTPFTSIKGNLPDRFVTDIAISPTNDDSVVVTLGGFGTAHVYITGNAYAGAGTIWTPLGGIGGSGRVNAVLPDVPFNAIVFDPVDSKIIYAGCDFGVYVSSDRGNTWVDYSTGFTDAVQVFDLQITSDNKIVAATHGKGVFRSDLFTGSTVLPVRLLEFAGANIGDRNKIHWKVDQEAGISRYELERSSDGNIYHTIATVSSGNSQTEITYTHNDFVGTANAEYYYRLKIIEVDGNYSYSTVVFIRVIGKNTFAILGNPVQDFVVLKYTIDRDQRIDMSIYNVNGALLKKQSYSATTGSGIYTLYGLADYPSGMYLIKIESGSYRQTFKVTKN